jgi:hypothetical protein
MNRDQLFDAMINRKPIITNGVKNFLNGMEMEDGSGFAFNLTLTGHKHKVFYRCQHGNELHPSYFIEII